MSTSTASPVSIERTALYELVWQEPMTKIAPRFGLSDVGLAKACKRNNIPRPPAGYWAKKAVGKAPRRTPLPSMKDAEAKPITFLADEKPKPLVLESQSERVKDEQLKALIAFEERGENKITVVENPSKLHEFVQGTKKWLAECDKPYEIRSLTPRYEGPTLSIDVSKSQRQRALVIFHSLIKAIEKRGHQIIFEKARKQYEQDRIYFVLLGEKCWLRIREKTKMIRIPESERASSWNRVRHEHSGLLEVQLWRKESGTEETKWIDGKKHRIEDHLNAIVIEMLVCVEEDREWRRIQQERAEQARANEMQRWQQQVERQKQEEKVNQLYQKIDKWERAASIRAFVADVRATNEERGGPIEGGSELDLYLTWAINHADAIDPLGAERKPQTSEPASEEWARPVQPR